MDISSINLNQLHPGVDFDAITKEIAANEGITQEEALNRLKQQELDTIMYNNDSGKVILKGDIVADSRDEDVSLADDANNTITSSATSASSAVATSSASNDSAVNPQTPTVSQAGTNSSNTPTEKETAEFHQAKSSIIELEKQKLSIENQYALLQNDHKTMQSEFDKLSDMLQNSKLSAMHNEIRSKAQKLKNNISATILLMENNEKELRQISSYIKDAQIIVLNYEKKYLK